MNSKKSKHVKKLLSTGNKVLLDALVKRYGEKIFDEPFKTVYKKAKQIFKDLQAGKPI
jgi:hypothetical protein